MRAPFGRDLVGGRVCDLPQRCGVVPHRLVPGAVGEPLRDLGGRLFVVGRRACHDLTGGSRPDAVEEATVLLDRAGEHPEMNNRADRLLDQVHDLADRRRQRGAGDDHLARPDDRRIVGFVEERPHESGLVLAVEVSP
jgi:hypothetical protein